MQQVGYILETICVVPLGAFISLLPWKTGRAFGRIAGTLAFYLNRRDKGRAYDNLDIIFAENPLSGEEKDRIIKKLFMNIASGVFEYFKIGSITEKNYLQFVRIENYEAIDRALDEKKGVLAITAHIGNWELLGSVGAKLRGNVGTIIKRQYNPYTDKWLKNIRERKGRVKCFYDESSIMIHIAKHLKQNGILAILADTSSHYKPIFVPFFGVQSATADGPAKLHLWYEAPIVLSFCVKQGDGKYLLSFDGPHHFKKSGDFKKDREVIMTWINQKYEELIRKYPDQWFSILTPRWEPRPEDFKTIPGVPANSLGV